ncbi:hypothetical protein NA57DRAFT_59696 [Rhizodiscina lignyota]|uniref:3-hydroxyisobutyrate dehydrogenase n=1 Tax=Rhizodiscina lignyota TaxID=1504668 RepID=A0A9P4I829_9PEZI|nr:hypothetical protein NA57DRAFT_59696 [Rhizodiscina lignyota]
MAGQTHPRVGFCGIGAMGGGMAMQLAKQNFIVKGFDIYKPFVDRLVAAGGKPAASPAEAAADAEVLVIMVTSHSQVTEVLFEKTTGAINTLPRDAIIIISSTVPPEYSNEVRGRLDNEYKRSDIHLLDCPVSGGTPRAAAGTLSIFSSGPEEGLKLPSAHAVLDAMSAKLYKIPGGIGNGSRAKMCHQVSAEVAIGLAPEVMALAARAGLNTQEVFDAVQASDGASWVNGNRIPHMLEGDNGIYSAVANSHKDTSIIVNESRIVHFPVFLTAAAETVFQAGIHAGWIKDDDTRLTRLYLPGYPDHLVHQLTKGENSVVPRNPEITVQDIIDIFVGANLAISAEAMGFTEAVGLQTDLMYDIISKGAGSNVQFIENVPKMKKPTWSLKDVEGAKDVGQKLAKALSKANLVGAAMPITAAAMQLFNLHLGSF